jgi:hypothetical protein
VIYMKEAFVDKRFGSEAMAMIRTINGILENYEAQGFDLSLRQLYYQLVAKALIENTERSYKNIGNLVSDARLAGLIDWDMIKDRGREMVKNPHWENPRQFLENVAPQFRFNLWHDQDVYVEVMVEKQALEGVLEPVCRSLDVPFTANKGYSSSSAMYEASKRFLRAAEDGKECYVVYLGDHDPSGIDMSRDVEERLDLFVKTSMGRQDEIGPNEPSAVTMKRVALNIDQVRELNPPENPAKITDSRADGYIRRFGTSSWELDAIEPRQLAQIVTDAVQEIMDVDAFEANREKMEKNREDLLKFAKKFFKDNGK